MKQYSAKTKKILTIAILLIVFSVSMKLILDYEFYGKYHYYGTKSKAGVLLIAIFSIIQLLKEIRALFKK